MSLLFQINAILLNFLFQESWKNKKYPRFHKNINQHEFLTLISISWAPNLQIRPISERSCDTEEWLLKIQL